MHTPYYRHGADDSDSDLDDDSHAGVGGGFNLLSESSLFSFSNADTRTLSRDSLSVHRERADMVAKRRFEDDSDDVALFTGAEVVMDFAKAKGKARADPDAMDEDDDDEDFTTMDDDELMGIARGAVTAREKERPAKTKTVGVLEKKGNLTVVGGEVVIGKEARGNVKVRPSSGVRTRHVRADGACPV